MHWLNWKKLEWTYGLTALPEGAFDALTNLEELNLSRNYLTALPDGAFDALTNLEELDLSRNYLTALPDGVFDALTNLEELNLSRNAISSMPHELFDDLPELTNLTVDRQNRKVPPDYPTRGRPVINGVAQVGQTLTVSTSGMSDQNGMTEATFEYRWFTHPYRRELQVAAGYDEGDTYTVGPDDEGKRILVKVKYTDDAGNRERIKSARTAPVASPPDEVIPPTSAPVHRILVTFPPIATKRTWFGRRPSTMGAPELPATESSGLKPMAAGTTRRLCRQAYQSPRIGGRKAHGGGTKSQACSLVCRTGCES